MSKYVTLASIKDQYKEEKLSGWKGARESLINEIAKTAKVWNSTAEAIYAAVEQHTMVKPELQINNGPEEFDDEEEDYEGEAEDTVEELFDENGEPQIRTSPASRTPQARTPAARKAAKPRR